MAQEREASLVRLVRLGDEAARATLVQECMPLLSSIAVKYRRWGVPVDELVQEGSIGLLRAIERFDPSRGRLRTYAYNWVRAYIREYVVQNYRLVRIGSTKKERRALRFFRSTLDCDVDSVARASGLSVDRSRSLMPMLAYREESLDFSGDGREPAVSKIPGDGTSPEELLDEYTREQRTMAALYGALDTLIPRDRFIVQQRWLGDEPIPHVHIANTLGVSRERVRQLEARALTRLRDAVTARADGQRFLGVQPNTPYADRIHRVLDGSAE